ncbi:hypothetical protein, partial [Escherichia coli]|uniref:hypothetical protein n=1 Tax=Escherichia coli TaxID=562 RepID=UPI001F3BE98E
MSHAVDGTYIKAQQDKMVNSSLCKKASVDTYFNVMEVNLRKVRISGEILLG